MKRERYLLRRLHTLGTLNEAVSAMRSLAAHHFRLSRQAIPDARIYREQIETALAEIGLSHPVGILAPPGFLLVVSDSGLCGDYNTRLVQAFLAEYQAQGGGPLYCVGHRPKAILARHQIQPQQWYPAPASVDGLPETLLKLARDVLNDFVHRTIGSLEHGLGPVRRGRAFFACGDPLVAASTSPDCCAGSTHGVSTPATSNCGCGARVSLHDVTRTVARFACVGTRHASAGRRTGTLLAGGFDRVRPSPTRRRPPRSQHARGPRHRRRFPSPVI